MEQINLSLTIEKTVPEQRRFFGKAYIHTNSDGQVEDHSGDVIDTVEAQSAMEEAFYGFVKHYRTGDMGHQVFDAATFIEGVVVTKEKKAAGLFPADMDEGYFVGFEADDTPEGHVLWEGIKDGTYKMLSIVGQGEKVAI